MKCYHYLHHSIMKEEWLIDIGKSRFLPEKIRCIAVDAETGCKKNNHEWLDNFVAFTNMFISIVDKENLMTSIAKT